MAPLRNLRVLVLVLFLVPASSAGEALDVPEFHAYLLPATNQAEIDSLVEIRFEVDSSATEFDSYEITVQFDPAIVSFDSVEEGDLMADACPSNFFIHSSTDSTVTVAHALLCGTEPIDGPGVLSVFSFRTLGAGTSPLDITTDPNRAFAACRAAFC